METATRGTIEKIEEWSSDNSLIRTSHGGTAYVSEINRKTKTCLISLIYENNWGYTGRCCIEEMSNSKMIIQYSEKLIWDTHTFKVHII